MGGVVSSSSTSRSVSKSFNSAWPGETGGVSPWENLKEDRELPVPTRVSSSDVLVDVLVDAECLKVFLERYEGGCGARVWVAPMASNFARALATRLPLETRDPGVSNA